MPSAVSIQPSNISRLHGCCQRLADGGAMLERELFKLREKCGVSVAEIAVAYGLDVDDGLASTIPFNNAENT